MFNITNKSSVTNKNTCVGLAVHVKSKVDQSLCRVVSLSNPGKCRLHVVGHYLTDKMVLHNNVCPTRVRQTTCSCVTDRLTPLMLTASQ